MSVITAGTPHVLVVTGFTREARIAAGFGSVVVSAGSDPARLRDLLGAKVAPPCSAVVSFGIAGGLDPALAPGSIVVATGIAAADQRWTSHPAIVRAWKSLLESRRERVSLADIAGVERPVLTAGDKGTLRAATGAAAVDMESHVAAEFAAARRLPFAAVRVICDPASRSLPPLVGEALRPDGRMDLAAILRHLARRPEQITALPRLARDAAVAFAALRRVRAALGPGLGLGGLSFGEPFGDVL